MEVKDSNNPGVYLTSVLKRMDSTVMQVIKQAMDGSFKGGMIVGTLANEGVGIAPYHSFDGRSGRAEERGRRHPRRHHRRLDQGRRLTERPPLPPYQPGQRDFL